MIKMEITGKNIPAKVRIAHSKALYWERVWYVCGKEEIMYLQT